MTPEFEVASVAGPARRRGRGAAAGSGSPTCSPPPAGAIATGPERPGQPERPAPPRGDRQDARSRLHVNLRAPAEPSGPRRTRPRRDPARRPATPPRDAGGRSRAATRATGYPTSLMGVVAHLRQAMLDAEHDHDARRPTTPRRAAPGPPFDPALEALHAARTRALPGLVGGEHPRRDPPGARPGRGVRHDGRDRRRSRGGQGRRPAQGEGRPGRPPARLPRRAQGPRPRPSTARREPSRARGAAQGPRRPRGEAGRSGSPPPRRWPRRASRSPSPSDGAGQARDRSTPRSARSIAAGLPARGRRSTP